MKYFYTFGTSKTQPFHGGWVEVEAGSSEMADAAFREHFPDHTPGLLNCAGKYTEKEFLEAGFNEKGNYGAFCNLMIDASEQPCEVPVKEEDVPEFIGQCIDIFEDFLDSKGVLIENEDNDYSESHANIYGTDYGDLSDELRGFFQAWGVIKKEVPVC